jgi:RNA polymerase sigma-B factor
MSISVIDNVTSSKASRAHRSAETARLFDEVAAATTDAARHDLIDQIIVLNLGVAQAVARRFRGRGIPDEDLEQVACMALVRAAQKFDLAHERDFLTYAVPTISGELKRHFRDVGWTIRPPRRIQEIQSKVIHAYRAGRDADTHPSAARLAAELDLPEDDVREALTVDGCFAPLSLDRPVHSEIGDTTIGETLADDDAATVQAVEARLLLAPALATLNERDRRIVHLRFVEERTQTDIGRELGITQMQVSRLITRILRDLRASLGDDLDHVA